MLTVLTPGRRCGCREGEILNGTVELNISYIRVAAGATVTATATVIRKGRTMCFAAVDLTDDQGRTVARGRITYGLAQPADGSSTADAPYLHGDEWLATTPFEHADFSAEISSGRPGHCRYRCALDPDWKHGGIDAPPGSAARTASRLTKRGGLKGTILAALVDVSCVSAVGTTVEKGEVMQGTVDLTISCAPQPRLASSSCSQLNKSALCGADIRPAAGAWVDATANVTRKGKAVAFADCALTDDQGRTVASGSIVYSIGQTAATVAGGKANE